MLVLVGLRCFLLPISKVSVLNFGFFSGFSIFLILISWFNSSAWRTISSFAKHLAAKTYSLKMQSDKLILNILSRYVFVYGDQLLALVFLQVLQAYKGDVIFKFKIPSAYKSRILLCVLQFVL